MAAVVLYGPQGLPLNPQIPMIVDASFYAARISAKPAEYSFPGYNGGHYRATMITTALAFAANAPIFDFFFQPAAGASGTLVAVLKRLRAQLYAATAITAQRMDPLVALFSRGYTAQSTTNATALALTGHNAKMRTATMGTCIAKLGFASAAAGISGGTRANDANPFGSAPLSGAAAVAGLGTGSGWLDLYKDDDKDDHPPTFGPSEGFTVNLGATAIATGTAIAVCEVEWLEALQY